MIRFRCPNCESQMEVDESFAGRPARCPTCGSDLKVPAHGEPAGGGARQAPVPGAARITVGGEEVAVVPPIEIMAIVSLACVGLSVVLFLLAGFTKFVTPPWAVGALLGALVALLGAIVGVPAYHSVRRSKGRRRGRTHALISMAAGGGLFLVLLVFALVGFARDIWLRPTCEQNLKQIHIALRQYADRHSGAFPASLETLASEGYLASADWLTCPAYKVPMGQNTYILTPRINIQVKRPNGTPWWPADTLLVSDGPPYGAHRDGGVRILLLDGSVNAVPTGQWAAYQKGQSQQWSHTLWEMREAGIQVEPPKGATPAAPGAAGEQAPAKEGAS